MDNLLFTALIIALLYYFFYYLPQKQGKIQPITQTTSTQTELNDEFDKFEKVLANTLDDFIQQIKQLNHSLK